MSKSVEVEVSGAMIYYKANNRKLLEFNVPGTVCFIVIYKTFNSIQFEGIDYFMSKDN